MIRRHFTPVHINSRKVFIWQLRLIFLLFMFHVISIILNSFDGYSNSNQIVVKIIVVLFNFDLENNIPTFYSATAILCSSIILFYFKKKKKNRSSNHLYWLALSIVFFFLSIDEIASIHERFSIPIENNFDVTGLFYRPWVIPYGIAVVIFCIFFLKFLIDLPRHFRYLFILSGATFVLGALGFEMLGARHVEIYGSKNITYEIIHTCEELLEMLGISLFIYTLLSYIVTKYGGINISLSDKKN